MASDIPGGANGIADEISIFRHMAKLESSKDLTKELTTFTPRLLIGKA
jgi:hypothetical protein